MQPQEDHATLVKLVQDVSILANVKLCVSSRPWQSFEKAFKPSLLFHLEDLNKRDIQEFVENRITESTKDRNDGETYDVHERGSKAWKLAERIVSKSSGVFLWVHFVMQRVFELLSVGLEVEDVQNQVDEIPAELNKYFRKLVYERISPTWRDSYATGAALKLAMLAHDPNPYVDHSRGIIDNHLIYWWYTTSLDRVGDANVGISSPFKELTMPELKKMLEVIRNFLKSACQDFLNIYEGSFSGPDKSGDRLYNLRIAFVHRTVFDFLSSDEMRVLLNRHVPSHFNDKAFHAQLNLAVAKLLPPPNMVGLIDNWFGSLAQALHCIVAAQCDLEQSRAFVRECESVAIKALPYPVFPSTFDGVERKYALSRLDPEDAQFQEEIFVYFRLYEYMNNLIKEHRQLSGNILHYALGGSGQSSLQISLTQIDLDFVHSILSYQQSPNSFVREKYPRRTVWELFLGRCMRRAWTLSPNEDQSPPSGEDGKEAKISSFRQFKQPFLLSVPEAEHLWQVCKVLIKRGADLDSSPCVFADQCHAMSVSVRKSQRHICQRAQVVDVLRAIVDKEHQSELRNIVKRRGRVWSDSLDIKIEVISAAESMAETRQLEERRYWYSLQIHV